ncbi:hypothetical protein F183_A35190 [Bryobacterales bacterium F-183]|nr:hypothetical protein F183_A35190 [Bryobacterales bacterium F-183]
MSKSETGEFELVLGNKQLLSVFFIVVILLCVFFTMGYIVGRNSSPPPLEANNRKTAEQPNPNPIIVDSPAAPPPSQIPTATETKPTTSDTKPNPVTSTPEPEPVKEKEKPKQPEPVKEVAKEKAKPVEATPAPAAAASGPIQRGAHYLQVQALPADQAALVVEVMRKKGFAATTEVVPNKPGLTRILVGPVTPGAAATDMKQKLDAAGFKGKQSILRKL